MRARSSLRRAFEGACAMGRVHGVGGVPARLRGAGSARAGGVLRKMHLAVRRSRYERKRQRMGASAERDTAEALGSERGLVGSRAEPLPPDGAVSRRERLGLRNRLSLLSRRRTTGALTRVPSVSIRTGYWLNQFVESLPLRAGGSVWTISTHRHGKAWRAPRSDPGQLYPAAVAVGSRPPTPWPTPEIGPAGMPGDPRSKVAPAPR
jgi:hypothetical protein